MFAGPYPLRTRDASSPERHIPHTVPTVLNTPVIANEFPEPLRRRLTRGHVGDHVHGLTGDFSRRLCSPPPVDTRGLDQVGKPEAEVGDGQHPHGACLTAAVPAATGDVLGGGVLPRQPSQRVEQRLLVALHGHDVVGLLVLDQKAGLVGGGVQGVTGDGDAGDVERGQQRGQGGDPCGLLRHPRLADRTSSRGKRGDQAGGRAGGGAGAAGGLAVHRHLVGAFRVASQQVNQTTGAHTTQQPLHRGRGRGRGRRPAEAERPLGSGTEPGQGVLGLVSGPLADRTDRTRPGQHRAAAGQQHRGQWRRPRRSRGSGNPANRSAMLFAVRSAAVGDLTRQTVADWRHIETPVVQGDLGRSPRLPESRCLQAAFRQTVTPPRPATT